MRKTIYVIKYDENWKIKCEHCNETLVYTQKEGLKIARKHIGELPEGTILNIKIIGKNNYRRTKWRYGRDPFPSAMHQQEA